MRVNMETREVTDFAVNRINGPASRLPHAGMERPSHCQFGPDGALYVVDFGERSIAPEKGGVRVWEGTGTLWRISRTEGPYGDKPPAPKDVPSYAIKAYLATAAAAVLTGATIRRFLAGGRK